MRFFRSRTAEQGNDFFQHDTDSFYLSCIPFEKQCDNKDKSGNKFEYTFEHFIFLSANRCLHFLSTHNILQTSGHLVSCLVVNVNFFEIFFGDMSWRPIKIGLRVKIDDSISENQVLQVSG